VPGADDPAAAVDVPTTSRGRPLRVGIEACTWSNRRGYGRFTRGLVGALVDGFPEHRFVLVVDRETAAQCTFPAGAELVVVDTTVQPTQAASAEGSRGIADIWRMSRALAGGRFDVVLFPTRYTFVPLPGRTPAVLTMHDATDATHPQLLFPSWRAHLFWRIKSALAIRRATRIMTVSHDARRQIAREFNLPEHSLGVVSEGPDPMFRPLRDEPALSAIRARFCLPAAGELVLYVGGISPHKNLQALLRAAARLPATAAGWHLVLVGDYQGDSFLGCHQELSSLARELGIDNRVTFTGFVADGDLALLYNAAAMLVLPSKGEGFGLPVIEAMACGVAVAASDRNSLPEVLGGTGLLFDPDRDDQIADAMLRLLSDPVLRTDLGRRGLERAQQYSWRAGAQTMMRVLAEAAG
jgi:glycosyltransferase involved in cell wall biosynthesis